ncbi:MAG: hypothetical protein M1814_000346 [Vezdaea aestivalis]|nr:MAG: hypothetical protein M1814_000346 [Vezdaea aestivalis]
MEMEGHGGGHGLAFITSTTTPLWSTQWTPSTTGQYAGTCIFLIILAFIQRSIGAYRRRLESRWRAADVRRRYVTVAGQTSVEDEVKVRGEEAKLLTGKGVEENVRVLDVGGHDV